MSYLLDNRLNRIEKQRQERKKTRTHFFTAGEFEEIGPQIDRRKDSSMFSVQYTAEEPGFMAGEIRKIKLHDGDTVIIDDL